MWAQRFTIHYSCFRGKGILNIVGYFMPLHFKDWTCFPPPSVPVHYPLFAHWLIVFQKPNIGNKHIFCHSDFRISWKTFPILITLYVFESDIKWYEYSLWIYAFVVIEWDRDPTPWPLLCGWFWPLTLRLKLMHYNGWAIQQQSVKSMKCKHHIKRHPLCRLNILFYYSLSNNA